MALTPTQQAVCNSLNQQFDGLIAPLLSGKSGYLKTLRQFVDRLENTTFSPQSTIDSALDSIKNSARANMPGSAVSDMGDLKNILDNCDFLNTFSPASAILSGATGLFNKISELISNTSITVPEFGLGALADQLKNLLDGSESGRPDGAAFKELFVKSDKLINCLSTICGEDVSSKIATLDGLIDDYRLDASYNLDLDGIYSSAGLSPTQITSMNTVINGISSINSEAAESITSAVSTIKSLTKIGGFF